jgi:copper chaperone
MEKVTLSIPNISCGQLGETAGVAKVEGDPTTKQITVEFDAPATMEKIRTTLKEINYPAAE